MMRRLGDSEGNILAVQSNLATTYHMLDRPEEANRMLRDVYSGYLRLNGEEHEMTLIAALNYANSLLDLKRFEEAKTFMRKMMPVARRVLGESHEITLRASFNYAGALYNADGATLDDIREAVTTLEENERTARRVFGGAHPLTKGMKAELPKLRAALRAREGGDVSAVREGVGAMKAT